MDMPQLQSLILNIDNELATTNNRLINNTEYYKGLLAKARYTPEVPGFQNQLQTEIAMVANALTADKNAVYLLKQKREEIAKTMYQQQQQFGNGGFQHPSQFPSYIPPTPQYQPQQFGNGGYQPPMGSLFGSQQIQQPQQPQLPPEVGSRHGRREASHPVINKHPVAHVTQEQPIVKQYSEPKPYKGNEFRPFVSVGLVLEKNMINDSFYEWNINGKGYKMPQAIKLFKYSGNEHLTTVSASSALYTSNLLEWLSFEATEHKQNNIIHDVAAVKEFIVSIETDDLVLASLISEVTSLIELADNLKLIADPYLVEKYNKYLTATVNEYLEMFVRDINGKVVIRVPSFIADIEELITDFVPGLEDMSIKARYYEMFDLMLNSLKESIESFELEAFTGSSYGETVKTIKSFEKIGVVYTNSKTICDNLQNNKGLGDILVITKESSPDTHQLLTTAFQDSEYAKISNKMIILFDNGTNPSEHVLYRSENNFYIKMN